MSKKYVKVKDFNWRCNSSIFRKWEEEGSDNIASLKESISMAQFGEVVEGKLLWIRMGFKKMPLILAKDAKLQELEKTVFPQIFNNYFLPGGVLFYATRAKILDTKSKAPGTTFITQKNFWKVLKDEDFIELRMTKDAHMCCFPWSTKGKF
ncbi:hypothetical protein D1R32_gp089 [Tunisvirus fontaine2]|uniref:Uncharacterized protein n=1 Tax=Tunisvirus fontaine2 TaxID=1421067 RepID=V9SES1_9VIRU|nr:hypothetical protein D1R32_gp089 [Tunisvirus fontaine2]AHC54806.1 hypothetical protein TNS_ORF88 [Tunisvirus fontaine2]